MPRSPETLRSDALRIWRAGVDAVLPARLVPAAVCVAENILWIGGEEFDLREIDRIVGYTGPINFMKMVNYMMGRTN